MHIENKESTVKVDINDFNAFNNVLLPSQVHDYILNSSNFLKSLSPDKILNLVDFYKNDFMLNKTFLDPLIKKLNYHGFLLVNNMPIDSKLPRTPHQKIDGTQYKSTLISETSLIFLSTLVGRLKNYADENSGDFIHNVHPVRNFSDTLSSIGSLSDLFLHNEIAYDKDKPDYIILLCLREGRNVPTYIAPINTALDKLSSHTIEILKQKFFFIRKPYSFVVEDDIYYQRSLIENINNKVRYFFNFNNKIIICCNDEAQNAYNQANQAFESVKSEVYLAPSQALIINNNLFLHGRASFKSEFDGKDRWLQRVYAKNM